MHRGVGLSFVCAALLLKCLLSGAAQSFPAPYTGPAEDAALPGCAELLANATSPWCMPRGEANYTSQEGRRQLLAAIWKCNALLESNSSTEFPLRILVWDRYASWLVPALQQFAVLYGVSLDLDLQPYEAQLQAMRSGANRTMQPTVPPGSLAPPQEGMATAPGELPASAGAPPHAVWLHASTFTQQLAEEGALLDISELVYLAQPQLDWVAVPQPHRLHLAMYGGRTVAVPLDASALQLFVRRDVAAAVGLSQVPQTWTQLVEFVATYRALVAAANASSVGTLPPYPICVARGAGCRREAYVQAVWSSLAQTHGSTQPIHFEPDTLEPLVSTPATLAAFRIMAQLLSAAAPEEPSEGCDHGSLAFARGRCALALAGFVPQMQLLSQPEAAGALSVGAVWTAPLPGSELVWQLSGGSNASQDGSLVPCTSSICPYATPLTTAAALAGDTSGVTETASLQQAQDVLVNRAPQLSTSLLVGSVNSRAPFIIKLLAFELLAYIASPDRLAKDEPGQPLQHVLPARELLVQPRELGVWQAAGYDMRVVQDALPALYDSMQHPNLAWGLRMAGQAVYNQLIGDTLAAIEAGNITFQPWVGLQQASNGSVQQAPLSEILAAGQVALAAAYPQQVFLQLYTESLSPWIAISRVPPDPGTNTTGGGGPKRYLLPVLLGVLLPAALACLAVAAWRLARRKGPGTMGCMVPKRKTYVPAPGVEAALCVTDIQDSTTLWECLPADVIAKAVDTHHRCVRKLALRHGGYESATEGDSFILAFADVRAAVSFALDLQAQLLGTASWPKQLLQQDVCKPVYTHLPAGYPFNHSGNSLHGAMSSRLRRTCGAVASPAPLEPQLRRDGGGGSRSASRTRLDSGDRSGGGVCTSGRMGGTSGRMGGRQPSRPWESSPLNSLLSGPFLPGRSLGHLVHSPSTPAVLSGGGGIALAAAASLPLAPSAAVVAESAAAAAAASMPIINPSSSGWCNTEIAVLAGACAAADEEAEGGVSARPSQRLPSEMAPWQFYRRSSGCGPSEITFGSNMRSVSRSRRATSIAVQSCDGRAVAPRVSSESQLEVDVSESLPRWNDSLQLGPAGGLSPHTDSVCEIPDGGILSCDGIDSKLWDEGATEGEAMSWAMNAVQSQAETAMDGGVDAAAAEAACRTLLDALQKAAAGGSEQLQGTPQQQQQQQLMFRGLRVRVGISLAVPTDAEVRYNAAAARMVYGGPCVSACKALADLAHGGQVFLSAAAHRAMAAEHQGHGGRMPGTMVLQVGILECSTPAPPPPCRTVSAAAVTTLTTDASQGGGLAASTGPSSHRESPSAAPQALQTLRTTPSFGAQPPTPTAQQLNSRPNPHSHPRPRKQRSQHAFSSALELLGLEPVYCVTSAALTQRLALVPPPRFRPDKGPLQDVYRAPLGRMAYAVVRVPAASTLLRWNEQVAAESLRLLVGTATAELRRVTGAYLVSASPAEVRAAFPSATLAVLWALNLRASLLAAPWPAELLMHEAGEPVEVFEDGPDGAGSQPPSDPATPRSRWGSAALLGRASSKMPWGVSGRRGSLPGVAAAAWEAMLMRAAAAQQPPVQQQQQRRRASLREALSPPSSRAELHLSTESGDENPDALEPLGRIAASTPLRRYRPSVEGCLPSPSLDYQCASPDCRSAAPDGAASAILGVDEAQALAELASHLGSPAAGGMLDSQGMVRGRSNTANGIAAAPPADHALSGRGGTAARRRSTTSIGRRSMDLMFSDPLRAFRAIRRHSTLVASTPAVAAEAAAAAAAAAAASPSPRPPSPAPCQQFVDTHIRDVAWGAASRPAMAVFPASRGGTFAVAPAAVAGRGEEDLPFMQYSGTELSASSHGTAAGAPSGGGGFLLAESRPRQKGQATQVGPPSQPQYSRYTWTEASPLVSERAMRGQIERSIAGGEPTAISESGEEATGSRDMAALAVNTAASRASAGVPVPPRRSSTVQPAPHCSPELLPAASAPIPALPWRTVGGGGAVSRLSDAAGRGRVLLRGLRIHVGIATGVVGWTVSSKAHSLAYTGRAVTKAGRLAAAAASGQVLCDEATQRDIAAAQQQQQRLNQSVAAGAAVAAAASPLPHSSMRMRRFSSRTVHADVPVSQRLQRLQVPAGPHADTGGETEGGGGEGSALQACRAARELRLVPMMPPGAARLSIRTAENLYLCTFESDAAQRPRLVHTPTPPSPFVGQISRLLSQPPPPHSRTHSAPRSPPIWQTGVPDVGPAGSLQGLALARPRASSGCISPSAAQGSARVHSEAGAAAPAGVSRAARSPLVRPHTSTSGWTATRYPGATSCPGSAPTWDSGAYAASSVSHYAERGASSLALSLPTGDVQSRHGCCSHSAGGGSECYGGGGGSGGGSASVCSSAQSAGLRVSPVQRFRNPAEPPFMPYIVCERVDEEDEASDEVSGDVQGGSGSGDDSGGCGSSSNNRSQQLQRYDTSGAEDQPQSVWRMTVGMNDELTTQGTVSLSAPLETFLTLQQQQQSDLMEACPSDMPEDAATDAREQQPERAAERTAGRSRRRLAHSHSLQKVHSDYCRSCELGKARESRLCSAGHAQAEADPLAPHCHAAAAAPASPRARTLAQSLSLQRRQHAAPALTPGPRYRVSLGSLAASYASVPGTEDGSASFAPGMEGDFRLLHGTRFFCDSPNAERASGSLVFDRQQSRGCGSPPVASPMLFGRRQQPFMPGGAAPLHPVSPAMLLHMGSSNGRAGSGYFNPPTLAALAHLVSSGASEAGSDQSASRLAVRVDSGGVAAPATLRMHAADADAHSPVAGARRGVDAAAAIVALERAAGFPSEACGSTYACGSGREF